jgi:hypothetical protein
VSPYAKRIAVLIIELMTFFLVTALMVYLVSHASALHYTEKDVPPPEFPVIAYVGDRNRPDAKNYLVVPWSEWEALAAKKPGASLLLPEKSGSVSVGADERATFTATPEGDSRQTVDLRLASGGGERQVRYVAQARSLSPRYLRTVTSTTILIGAALGFLAGYLVGRTVRYRWLPQPGYYAPPPPK